MRSLLPRVFRSMGWTAGARGGVWRDSGLRPFASARIPGSSGISPVPRPGPSEARVGEGDPREISGARLPFAPRLESRRGRRTGDCPSRERQRAGGDGNPTLISMADVVEAYEGR